MRGRATFTRPFDRVDALRRNAEDQASAPPSSSSRASCGPPKRSSRRSNRSATTSPRSSCRRSRRRSSTASSRRRCASARSCAACALGLDQDITSLGNRLKVINIVLVPLVFVIVAVLFALWRRSKRAEFTSPTQPLPQRRSSAAEPEGSAAHDEPASRDVVVRRRGRGDRASRCGCRSRSGRSRMTRSPASRCSKA